MLPSEKRNKFGLLLTGGGARAAYQIGVLKAITTFLPRNHGIPFKVICGTSAGGINALCLASFASCYHLGVKKLESVWRNFHTHQVYKSKMREVYSYLGRNFITGLKGENLQPTPASLLDNSPLRNLLNQVVDYHRIDRNLTGGYLASIGVTTSCYRSGDSVCFYQSDGSVAPWRRHGRRGESIIINTDHLMASSAIPMVFPTIAVNGQYYGDGAIHLTAPVSPLIHMGAEKILIVGVDEPAIATASALKQRPNISTIAGLLLDTVFADSLNSDLERIKRINQTLSLLTEKQQAKTELKPIDFLRLTPSSSINTQAEQSFDKLPSGIRSLLRLIGIKHGSDSSLTSYLLFEAEYCRQLIEMGFEDGLTRKQELKDFLEL